MNGVTIVVMAYNEAATLDVNCRDLLSTNPAELLIIDDGSTDRTADIANKLAASDPRVRVVRHPRNRGLGGVYRTGFQEARGTYLTFFPADGQFPASIVTDFAERIGDLDLVLGTTAGASTLSTLEQALFRVVFGPMPRFQGIFMVRVARLRELTLRSSGRGWTIVTEMILRAARAGWRIESRETPLRPRAAGRSKVRNLRTIAHQLRQTWTLWRDLRRDDGPPGR